MTHKNASTKLRIAVAGARGYSGVELVRLLLHHPQVELRFVVSGSEPLDLSEYLDLPQVKTIQVVTFAWLAQNSRELDVLFLATPAELSTEVAPLFLRAGVDVIDLSGAHRLPGSSPQEREVFRTAYGFQSPELEILGRAEYGLIPFVSAGVSSTSSEKLSNGFGRLIANPGCYATASLMALIPLLKHNILKTDSIVVDAKSGTTGAGRKATEKMLFSEVYGDLRPYRIGNHQHLPEIQMALRNFAKVDVDLFFTPHLLPIPRGIMASIYAVSAELGGEELETAIAAAYRLEFANYPLAQWGAAKTHSRALSLKNAVGSSRTNIVYETNKKKIFLFATIDNLLKGAASQAVENLNRLNDWPISLGIELDGHRPADFERSFERSMEEL